MIATDESSMMSNSDTTLTPPVDDDGPSLMNDTDELTLKDNTAALQVDEQDCYDTTLMRHVDERPTDTTLMRHVDEQTTDTPMMSNPGTTLVRHYDGDGTSMMNAPDKLTLENSYNAPLLRHADYLPLMKQR
jgi:hypothetical protein